jgi:hypothetical protein
MSRSGVGTFVVEDHELASSGLALFDLPSVDKSLVYGKFLTVYPSSVLSDAGPHDFIVPSDGQDFTDLPYTRLEGCIEINKLDGGKMTDTELNAYCNLLPQSLFKQIEIYVNNTQVSDISAPTAAWKAAIETILTFPESVKNTTLQLEYFSKDTLGEENTFTLTTESFKKRHAIIKNGKIYFSMILHLDFLQSTKFLLPKCELKFKFIQNEDSFTLLGASLVSKIKIHELKLLVRRLTVHPSIAAQVESQLLQTPAVMPIAASKINTYIINKGVKTERISNIYRGVLPRSFIVTFVDTEAFNSTISKNPFVFKHYKLNYFQAYINGEPLLTEVFQPDFSNNKFHREYRWFLDNLGFAHDRDSNGITMEEFKTNSFFLPFDLSPDLSNGATLSTPKEGSLDFLIGFEGTLSDNITMIVFATFNEGVVIDAQRNVTLV